MRKFDLGQLVATCGVAAQMETDSVFFDFVNDSLRRYINCDWGVLDEEDKYLNDDAVKTGDSRILAAYIHPQTNEKIWIITEWDRSATTILFPHEY